MSAFKEQQLKKLESALAALTPRPAAVDRDQLLFEAGRRSVRPNPAWRWSTFGVTALAALLVVALLSRSQAIREVQFVHVPGIAQPHVDGKSALVPEIPAPDDDFTLSASSYGRMRQAALSVGVEHMPMADIDAAASDHASREPTPTVGARGVIETLRIMGDN